MFGPLVMGPGAALVRAQYGRGAQEGQEFGILDLLNDIMSGFDSTECILIGYMLLLSFGVAFFMISVIVIMFVPPTHVHWFFYYMCPLSLVAAVVATVLLIEPRASHWLPSFQSIRSACEKWDPRLWRQRVRAWWLWRNRYERQRRSKLNV